MHSACTLIPLSGSWRGQQVEGQQLSKGACYIRKPLALQGLVICMHDQV